MPELPEVETVRTELDPWLTGATIVAAKRANAPAGPKYRDLDRAAGQRIMAVTRRGKFLIMPLSDGDELIVHLGMTGQISQIRPKDHLRVEVTLGDTEPSTLFFRDVRRFGRFLVAQRGDRRCLPTLDRMGPEPLSPEFRHAPFRPRLSVSRQAIKPFLLSQRPVAGVGNIYADEALWKARIHPTTPSNTVSKLKATRLRDALVAILTAAVNAGGTTLSDYQTVAGDDGNYQRDLWVYGRENAPCPRCQTPITKIVVAQRGTHFCGKCQRPRQRRHG